MRLTIAISILGKISKQLRKLSCKSKRCYELKSKKQLNCDESLKSATCLLTYLQNNIYSSSHKSCIFSNISERSRNLVEVEEV